MPSKNSTNKRPLVFLGVGVLNTGLDFLFYTLLTTLIFRNGSHIALVGILSGTVALLIAFTNHSLITWRDKPITHFTMLKFFLFTGFGMWVLRPILLYVFIKMESLFTGTKHLLDQVGVHFSYNFIANTGAFGCMVIVVLLYNYFVYSRYVFTDKEPMNIDPKSHSAS